MLDTTALTTFDSTKTGSHFPTGCCRIFHGSAHQIKTRKFNCLIFAIIS